MPGIIATRLANALFPDATPDQAVIGAHGPVAHAIASFARRHGGLWVGGKAVLTDEGLGFAPNALNRAVHAEGGALRLDLPLGEIRSVTKRFGWVTGIIDIGTDGGTFSLRCYGAKAFAAQIAAAAGVELGG
jgi:hypothetical protein